MCIEQTYLLESHEVVSTNLKFQEKDIQVKVRHLETDVTGSILGFIPNFIHSLDAAVLHKMIISLPKDSAGVPALAGTIHDSVGCKATDVIRVTDEFASAFGLIHFQSAIGRMSVSNTSEFQKEIVETMKG